jgi:hypothetical protein
MRSFVLFLLVSASAFAQERASPLIDPAKRAVIEELFSLTKLDQLTEQMLTQFEKAMKPQIEKSLPPEVQASGRGPEMLADIQSFENQVFALVKDRVDFAKLKPEYIKLYDETFTTEELTGIVGFYKSPAGQASLQKLPMLTSKSVGLASKIMGDSMQELQEMTAGWTGRMKKKYGDSGPK